MKLYPLPTCTQADDAHATRTTWLLLRYDFTARPYLALHPPSYLYRSSPDPHF